MKSFVVEGERIAEASVICPGSTEVFGHWPAGSHVADAVVGE